MNISTIITSFGLGIILIYGIIIILNFYGINNEMYSPFIAFYVFILVSSIVLPRHYKLYNSHV